MAQAFVAWAEVEIPQPLQLFAQPLTLSQGTLTPKVTLPLVGFPMTASRGVLLQGVNQAYVAWAEVELPFPQVATAALVGQAMTASQGTIAAGNRQAFVAWAELDLPQPFSISGLAATLVAGSLSPVQGTVVGLTGIDLTSSAGALAYGRAGILTSQAFTLAAGLLKFTDDPILVAGQVAPLVEINPLHWLAMSMQAGFLTVIVDGTVNVPLVGMTIGSEVGNLGPDFSITPAGQLLALVSGTILGSLQASGNVTLVGVNITSASGRLGLPGEVPATSGFPGSGGQGQGAKALDVGKLPFMERVTKWVKKGLPLTEAMKRAEQEISEEDAIQILALISKEGRGGKANLRKIIAQLVDALDQLKD